MYVLLKEHCNSAQAWISRFHLISLAEEVIKILFYPPFQYTIECSGKGGTPEPLLLATVGRSGNTYEEQNNLDKTLLTLDSSIFKNPDTGENTYSKVGNSLAPVELNPGMPHHGPGLGQANQDLITPGA